MFSVKTLKKNKKKNKKFETDFIQFSDFCTKDLCKWAHIALKNA